MAICPACSHEAPHGSRFCPLCATLLKDDWAATPPPLAASPTPTPLAASATPTPPAPTPAPNLGNDVTLTAPLSEPSAVPPADGPRFVSGAILAGRYRIVGLLGRGGMGEVYRADDLKLGQSVALKFLPQGLDSDHERLRRLLDEVRVALRVTHTNVCRVYDIGEIDGSHYLSMEYIDGEDLSALLRRIGRLPEDKAIQIARQLCAGLAAAHEQGILHRDLKPANVMIDGRGDVRITDFGLAGLADSFTGLEIRAGTPAFMAPEQLAGKEVTVKSDIYALGLVLYELFTGQRAFTGQSIEELSEMQASGPSRPSTHVELLDPTVESVILRCLANDPAERPDSVLKVAVALPGADPLAAALAAGETPSPELVAESGDDSGLEPRVAVPIMVLTLLGLLASAWLIGRYQLLGRVPMELPPQVLAHRAQEIAESLGYADPPADRAWGFRTQPAVLEHLANDPSPDRWERLSNARPSAIRFWYRQSPFPLIPQNAYGRVGFNDPQVRYSGMVNLFLDSTGRLTHLKAVPPQYDDAPPDQPQLEPDWRIAFEAAELEFERFTPTTPHWLPEKYCDRRAAWLGVYPSGSESVAPSIEVRVEACAYRGRLIQFAASPQIGRPFLQEAPQRTRTQQVRRVAEGLVAVIFLLGTVMLARRNLALGRGDRRSALLLATWVAVTSMGTWLFQASHVLDLNIEKILINRRLGNALFDAAVFWLFYIALEPFVRSRWPKSLVSWNRLLAGRLNDPLVGRHLLYGAALGVGIGLMHQLGAILPMLVGKAQAMPRAIDFDTLLGTHWVLGEMFDALRVMATDPLAYLLFLVLLRVVLRNSWAALAVFAAVSTVLHLSEAESLAIAIGTNLASWSAIGLFLMRFGLVSIVGASFFSLELLRAHPLTLDFTTWYAGSSLVALGAGVVFILWAFRTALGDRPLFAEDD